MKHFKRSIVCLAVAFLAGLFVQAVALAWDPPDPRSYIPTQADYEKAEKYYDDPRSASKELDPARLIPRDLYDRLVFDKDQMKKEWANLIGFKGPDVVGKIAPEIKPGKYTYQDLEKYPGLKQLLPPHLLAMFKPGGPPHAGNFPEFELIPTQQYYHSLPVSQYTKKNMGKTRLDEKGYLIPSTWEGGVPFPRPSGKFKAQQIMYNVEKRYLTWDGSFYMLMQVGGFRKDLSQDYAGTAENRHMKLAGRAMLEPYGWADERAKQRGEYRAFVLNFTAPRDSAGTSMSALYYLDPNKADLLMVYVPQLRRIRMLTASDSQDPIQGQDLIYDDNEGFLQKLSPTRFPYNFEVIEEREYLVRSGDPNYIASKGRELKNVKLERRPIYVVKLTQLDPNYVYSKRIFYVDRETFMFYHVDNYDQKGRLYRSINTQYPFYPEMGVMAGSGIINVLKDHVDLHSGLIKAYAIPAFWKRQDTSLEGYIKSK